METLYEGFGWKVTMEEAVLPDGRQKKGARIHRADSAHIISFKTDTTILMLREFRPFYGEYVWMIPSGKADKEGDILEAARRELREETGHDARQLKYYCNGNLSDTISITNHVFVARDLFESPLEQDHDELMEVHEMTLDEALKHVLASPKIHLVSAYALLRYMREHQ